jgi:hypothetical protein
MSAGAALTPVTFERHFGAHIGNLPQEADELHEVTAP